MPTRHRALHAADSFEVVPRGGWCDAQRDVVRNGRTSLHVRTGTCARAQCLVTCLPPPPQFNTLLAFISIVSRFMPSKHVGTSSCWTHLRQHPAHVLAIWPISSSPKLLTPCHCCHIAVTEIFSCPGISEMFQQCSQECLCQTAKQFQPHNQNLEGSGHYKLLDDCDENDGRGSKTADDPYQCGGEGQAFA